jgi:hypothetical protein
MELEAIRLGRRGVDCDRFSVAYLLLHSSRQYRLRLQGPRLPLTNRTTSLPLGPVEVLAIPRRRFNQANDSGESCPLAFLIAPYSSSVAFDFRYTPTAPAFSIASA